ncbi:MAG: thioredoxin domain-containing protein, partial [Bacteroidota bacterium]|nr:thioredoxin domain-containing protein [Bacteroidota bacterium]
SLHSPKEIIFTGSKEEHSFKELKKVVDESYIPNKVLLYASGELMNVSKFISNIVSDESKLSVYVCENYQCNLPVSDPEKLNELLQ